MSAIKHLVAQGVRPVVEGGRVGLLGLKELDPAQARAVLDYARTNKAAILAEIEAQAEDPADAYRRLCPAYPDCYPCPDANFGKTIFCQRLRTPDGGWRP